MKIVYIRWMDACTEEARDPHYSVKPALAELSEVGFLLGETEDAVTIGMEYGADDIEPGRFRLHIPRGQIKERVEVDLKTFLRKKRVGKGVSITEGR